MGKRTFINGEVVVYFKDGVSKEDVEKIAKDLGLTLIQYFEFIQAARFGCEEGYEHRAMWDLAHNELVASVDHNYTEVELIKPVKG